MKYFDIGIEWLYDIFLASPSQGIFAILSLWVTVCWFYRLVSMGPRMPFHEILLRPFSVPLDEDMSLTSLNSRELTVTSDHEDGEYRWTLQDVYLAYWAVRAKRIAIFSITSALFLIAFGLVVMHLADPKEEVSLLNVLDSISYLIFLPFLMIMILICFAKMLGSIHKVPSNFNKKQNSLFVILFGW